MHWSLRTPDRGPPATDDLSGLISQPAPGWKIEHWFNSEPLALQDLRGNVVLVRSGSWVRAARSAAPPRRP